jgi:predicted Ser/Thr protein kinase
VTVREEYFSSPESRAALLSRWDRDDTPEEERFAFFAEALEKYGEKLGTGHRRIWIPKRALSEQDITEDLGFIPVSIAVPEAGQESATSFRHTDYLYHLHRFQEGWTLHRDEHESSTMVAERIRKQKGEVSIGEHVGAFLSGLPHIIGEGVPGMYHYLRGAIFGVEPMYARLRETIRGEYEEIVSGMKALDQEGWFSSIFSGRDDEYNTISGLRHGGVAGATRAENTGFGSGWDVARWFARKAGMEHGKFLRSSVFRGALSRGKKVRRLGEGAQGTVDLYETTLMGRKFPFVKKTAREWEDTTAREAWFTEKLQEGIVPSVYGKGKGSLYLEYMEGETLGALAGRGYSLPESVWRDITGQAKRSLKQGIYNEDIINAENILFNPATGRTSWIDWGLARTFPEVLEKKAPWTQAELRELATGQASAIRMLRGLVEKRSNRAANPIHGLGYNRSSGPGDHSSPWKGLFKGISGKISKYMARGGTGKKLLSPHEAARLARGETLEGFAGKIGEPFRIMRTEAEEATFKQFAETLPGLRTGAAAVTGEMGDQYILMSPRVLRSSFMSEATKAGMPIEQAARAVESEDFLKTVLYHEVLEKQVLASFTTRKTMPALHHGAQVLIGEGGFAQSLGNKHVRELFSVVRGQRGEERAAFSAGLEAFGKEGVTPALRKLVTDFGSGYRGIIGSAGKKAAEAMSGGRNVARSMLESSRDLRVAQNVIWKAGSSGGKGHLRYKKEHIPQLFGNEVK